MRMIIFGLLSICLFVITLVFRIKVHTLHYAPVLDGVLYGILLLVGIAYTYAGFRSQKK